MSHTRYSTITFLATAIIVVVGVMLFVELASRLQSNPLDTSISDKEKVLTKYAWQSEIACTKDLKICPDGSYVSRSAELNCSFPTCPDSTDFVNSAKCGNGICDTGEDPEKACSPPVCVPTAGGLRCKPIPTFAPSCSEQDLQGLCPTDCQRGPAKSACGNNICEVGEANLIDCPACADPSSPGCSHRACVALTGSCVADCKGVNQNLGESDPGVVCAQDAFICPDGTEVGRSGPNCQFACPVSVGCKGDYDGSGVVSLNDLSTFIKNYKKEKLNCSLDVVGDDCVLDLRDLQQMARVYKKEGVCATLDTN